MALYRGREVNIESVETFQAPTVKVTHTGASAGNMAGSVEVVALNELELTNEEKEQFEKAHSLFSLVNENSRLPRHVKSAKEGELTYKTEDELRKEDEDMSKRVEHQNALAIADRAQPVRLVSDDSDKVSAARDAEVARTRDVNRPVKTRNAR